MILSLQHLIVVGLLLQLSESEAIGAEIWPSNAEELDALVFAREGDPIEPEKTLVLLNQLEAASSDKLTNSRRRRIKALSEASKLDPTKCRLVNYLQLNFLFSYNSPFATNIIPYLKFCKRNFFSFCKQNFIDQAQEAIAKLSADERANAAELVRRIVKTSDEIYDPYFFVPRTSIVSGTIGFIEEQTGPMNYRQRLGKKKGRDEIERIVGEKVGDLCDNVRFQLESLVFLLDEDFVDQLDTSTRDWLVRAKVCREIVNKFDVVMDEIHVVLKKSYPKPRKSLFKLGRDLKSSSEGPSHDEP